MKRLLQLRRVGMRPKGVFRSVCLALSFIVPGGLMADEVTLPKFISSPVTNSGITNNVAAMNGYVFTNLVNACAQSKLFKVLPDKYKNSAKNSLGGDWKNIKRINISDGSKLNYADVQVLRYLMNMDSTSEGMYENVWKEGTGGTLAELCFGEGVRWCKETITLLTVYFFVIPGRCGGDIYQQGNDDVDGFYIPTKAFYSHVSGFQRYESVITDNTCKRSTLEKIYFPSDLKYIGLAAFYASKNLSEIYIPSIDEVKAHAFRDCPRAKIYLQGNSVPVIGNASFKGGAKLFVPLSLVNEYREIEELKTNTSDSNGPYVFPLISPTKEWTTFSYWRPVNLGNVSNLSSSERQLEFYVISNYMEGGELVIEPFSGVLGTGKGVLVHCANVDDAEVYALPYGANSSYIKSNLLTSKNALDGSIRNGRDLTTAWNISDAESHQYYLLSGGNFYRMSNTAEFPAWRAFLNLDGKSLAKSHGLMFPFTWEEQPGSATAIAPAGVDEADTGAWYTLAGVRLSQKPMRAGIYVHGGKKIVIK